MKTHTKERSMQSLTSAQISVQNDRGFTLVELLIVVVIIGVLATFAMNSFYLVREKARVSRATSEVRYLEKEILAWATEKGDLPTSLGQIGRGVDPGNPLSENMHDPWGRPYEYTRTVSRTWTGGLLNTDYDLFSKGVDGIFAPSTVDDESLDDIIRADNGGFAGVARRYAIN